MRSNLSKPRILRTPDHWYHILYDKLLVAHRKDHDCVLGRTFSCCKKERIYWQGDNYFLFLRRP